MIRRGESVPTPGKPAGAEIDGYLLQRDTCSAGHTFAISSPSPNSSASRFRAVRYLGSGHAFLSELRHLSATSPLLFTFFAAEQV
jgi:hypothetical protein